MTFRVFALFDVSGGLCCLPFRVVCVVDLSCGSCC